MSIRPLPDTVGRVLHGAPPAWFRPDVRVDARTRKLIEDRIVVLFAGPLAEERSEGTTGLHEAVTFAIDDDDVDARFFISSFGTDVEKVLKLAEFLAPAAGDLNRLVAALRDRAAAVLRAAGTWAAVEAVAAALTRFEVMTADEARAAMTSVRTSRCG